MEFSLLKKNNKTKMIEKFQIQLNLLMTLFLFLKQLIVRKALQSLNKDSLFQRTNLQCIKCLYINKSYNKQREEHEMKHCQIRDFFHTRKVDTHIHHSACMTVMLFLKFMRKKIMVILTKKD